MRLIYIKILLMKAGVLYLAVIMLIAVRVARCFTKNMASVCPIYGNFCKRLA